MLLHEQLSQVGTLDEAGVDGYQAGLDPGDRAHDVRLVSGEGSSKCVKHGGTVSPDGLWEEEAFHVEGGNVFHDIADGAQDNGMVWMEGGHAT